MYTNVHVHVHVHVHSSILTALYGYDVQTCSAHFSHNTLSLAGHEIVLVAGASEGVGEKGS